MRIKINELTTKELNKLTMNKEMQIYLIWLALVVVWNFGYPTALPIYDVAAAIFLSIIAKMLNSYRN